MTDRPFQDDVWCLVRTSPYLRLAKPGGAEWFLRRHVSLAEGSLPELAAYPGVHIEPLEFYYTCLRSLGALNTPLVEAFLRDCTWRGVVWASWLAILEPRKQFLPALRDTSGKWPHNEWLLQCAVAAVEGEPSAAEHEAFLELGVRCRELLRGVKRPLTRLRAEPTQAQVAQMSRERDLVRTAYAAGGAEAVPAVLAGTLLRYYTEGYATWAARTRRNEGAA